VNRLGEPRKGDAAPENTDLNHTGTAVSKAQRLVGAGKRRTDSVGSAKDAATCRFVGHRI
jgi:hypothetical protein